MILDQKTRFQIAYQKLPVSGRKRLDRIILQIMADPEIHHLRQGELADCHIHISKINKQAIFLAYHYDDETITLTLLALGVYKHLVWL